MKDMSGWQPTAQERGMVNIIIDSVLDSSMVVESKGMNRITQGGCE